MKELAILPPGDGGGGGGGLTIPGPNGGYIINAPGGIPQGGGQVEVLIRSGITFALVVSSLLALFFLIYGGVKWISSGGDEKAVDTAKKTVTYAIIGLVLILASFLILNFIGGLFGIKLTP